MRAASMASGWLSAEACETSDASCCKQRMHCPHAVMLVCQAHLHNMLPCPPLQTSPVWPTIDAAPGAALNITNSNVQMYPNQLCSPEQIALAARNIAALAGRADAAVPDGLTGRITDLSLQLPVANTSGAAGQPLLCCTRTLLHGLAMLPGCHGRAWARVEPASALLPSISCSGNDRVFPGQHKHHVHTIGTGRCSRAGRRSSASAREHSC